MCLAEEEQNGGVQTVYHSWHPDNEDDRKRAQAGIGGMRTTASVCTKLSSAPAAQAQPSVASGAGRGTPWSARLMYTMLSHLCTTCQGLSSPYPNPNRHNPLLGKIESVTGAAACSPYGSWACCNCMGKCKRT